MKIEHVFINFPNLYLILIWLINKIELHFLNMILYKSFITITLKSNIFMFIFVDAFPFYSVILFIIACYFYIVSRQEETRFTRSKKRFIIIHNLSKIIES